MSYTNFDLAIYVTAQAVINMPDTDVELEKEFNFYDKHLNVSKVYLETFRDDTVPGDKMMKVKKFFNDRGIKTSTGITYMRAFAVGADMSKSHYLCYNDDETLALIKDLSERMANEFDEIIIDDIFCTDCTCETCRAAKGDMSWAEYRTKRMAEISRDYIINPAKKINPDVNIIIKFPTWGESLQRLGYNTEIQPFIFDKVYAGTETRHNTYSIFRNPRYTSFSILMWFDSINKNNMGGWFDSYMCGGSINNYLEQAYLTLLTKTKEITLFCYDTLINTPQIAALGVELERFDKFIGELGNPVGISTYLPFHSSGEDHIYDYLGMAGVPIVPSVYFPDNAEPVLLTAAAACDKDIINKIKKHLLRGGDTFVTPGFMRLTQEEGIDDFTGMRVTDGKITENYFGSFEHAWSDEVYYTHSSKDITFPVVDWKTNDCDFLAVIAKEEMPTPLFAFSKYDKGKFYLLNMPDVWTDTYSLPEQLLTLIRKKMSSSLNVYIESESHIALFCYDNNTIVIQSFLQHGSVVKIHIKDDIDTIKDIINNKDINLMCRKNNESIFEIAVPPLNQIAIKY